MSGVFRRRPDYARPRRLVLAVAAAAVVGPTLFVRPSPPRSKEIRHQYYQRRQLLPPTLAGGGPPAGPPPNLRPKRQPEPRVLSRAPDSANLFRLNQRRLSPTLAGGGPPAGPPPNLRPKRLPQAQALTRLPDYAVIRRDNERRLPHVIFVAPLVTQLEPHRVPQPRAFVRRTDYEVNRLTRRLLPPTLAGGGPPAGPPPNLRAHRPPLPEAFRRLWDYRIRRLLPPTVALVPTVTGVIAPKPLPLPQQFRARTAYEALRLVRRQLPTRPFVAPPPIAIQLRSRILPPTEMFRRLWDYASSIRRRFVRLPSGVVAPELIKLTDIAGSNPALDAITGASPEIDLIAGRNPVLDDITGKC